MKNIVVLSLLVLLSCTSSNKDNVQINVTDQVLVANYMGNGAEWDPYCEAEVWGAPMTQREWDIVFKRVEFMKMSLVRCMINSPLRYYDAKRDCYERDRNIESLKIMLDFCQKNDIQVMFGEFNSPTPQMRTDPRWVGWAVDYLNHLVVECGFSCIKYYIPCNEPDGAWAVTEGDYQVWRTMTDMFIAEIAKYPALAEHISLASPDAVVDYKNPAYGLSTVDWVANTAKEMSNHVGLYDVHAYPGQTQVINGEFAAMLKDVLKVVPQGKRIVLGEAGYKTWRDADSVLNKTHIKRLNEHPLIADKQGSDCNMLVYDYSYGLDMPILAMEVMNSGYAGMTAWMLDDTHTNGDVGDLNNVKVWGMWNILASRVWNMPEQEQIRPWYYSWALMCRYFRSGTDVLQVQIPDSVKIKAVAGVNQGKLTVALVNYSDSVQQIDLGLPVAIENGLKYVYSKSLMLKDSDGLPVPAEKDVNAKKTIEIKMEPQSFVLVTGQQY